MQKEYKPQEFGRWHTNRELSKRIQIRGKLELLTPTHLGSGAGDGPLDMPILIDPISKKPLLTGTNLAGALRSYVAKHSPEKAQNLFGYTSTEESSQSLLYIDNALGENANYEIRDGVSINPKTKTAEDHKKYNIQLITVGTTFEINLELLVPKDDSDQLEETLSLALYGLESGEITLGKRKRRGYGKFKISSWEVTKYDLENPQGMLAWLTGTAKPETNEDEANIESLLCTRLAEPNQEKWCYLDATFLLSSSIMIRSAGKTQNTPDNVHIHSWRQTDKESIESELLKGKPVIPGTGLAGALRNRTIQIGNTICGDNDEVTAYGYTTARSLFGSAGKPTTNGTNNKMTSSRIWVEESVIDNPVYMVQDRIKIDRFTGGVYPGAKFDELPIFSNGKDTTVTLKLKIQRATDADVGLLLLLLKDLWTEDLPIGGEAAIGRGRLKGMNAKLKYESMDVEIRSSNDCVEVFGDPNNKLQGYVAAFNEGGK